MTIRRLNSVLSFSAIALLAMTSQAQAQTAVNKVGDILTNVANTSVNVPNILSVVAYMAGLIFATTGLFKFKDHVDFPHQNPLSHGVKRFLAGGMMFALPYIATSLHGSLFTSSGSSLLQKTSSRTAPTGTSAEAMIVNFVNNMYGPATLVLTTFCYIAAIILLLVAINRLTKTAQEGPRGPAGLGTIMTFLSSGALFSLGDMMTTFVNSLFGTTTVFTYATISPSVISNAGDAATIGTVVEAVMTFIMLIGFIAFIRGWFVLKAFADGGNGNATLAQALTFLFGGALAINLGELVNVLQNTVGVSGITFS